MLQKKICLLGAFSVGKTSLIKRYVTSLFDERYLTTVGVKIEKKEVAVGAQAFKLLIWDLAGEDEFTRLRTNYLRGTSACVIVIDGTRRNTVDTAKDLVSLAQRELGTGIPIVVALNKYDMIDQWDIDISAVQAILGDSVSIVCTSAKTGEAVEEMFDLVAQLVVDDMSRAA